MEFQKSLAKLDGVKIKNISDVKVIIDHYAKYYPSMTYKESQILLNYISKNSRLWGLKRDTEQVSRIFE